MYAGTLASKVCKSCGGTFRRGVDNKVSEEYCLKCTVVGWQQEMYDLGCKVAHPKYLGKEAHVVDVKFKDCPKVKIDGMVYRDTTDLLFESTKYKTTYPTQEELREIQYANQRRRNYIMRKAMMERIGKIDIQTEASRMDAVEKLINEGENGEEIIEQTGMSRYFYFLAMEQLAKEGRLKRIRKEHLPYTKKEDEELIKMELAGVPRREMAILLKRTIHGIKGRIQKFRKEGRL